jgi:acetylornithine deacetylase
MPETSTVELLKQFVAIPSVNPAHTDDPAIANEFRMANFLGEVLTGIGFEVEQDRVTPERGNVIGRFGPANPQRTILFEAHLDTVGVSDMVIPPFEPRIENGRLYGRGSCDMKGAMAAALTAMDAGLLQRIAARGIEILFVGAYGEEAGNQGAERLVAQGRKAHQAVVLEPTDLSIVYAHKGALWLEVTLTGEAGHGSDPDRGRNAIFAIAELVQWLRERNQVHQVEHQDPILGKPTLNIGRIDGGLAINIVAHRCRLEIDRRVVASEDNQTVVAEIQDYLNAQIEADRIRSADVRVLKSGRPFVTSADSALVQSLQAALTACNCAPELKTAAWFSDAGPLSVSCDEIVVFGPGSIHQAHTVDEYIELAELEKGRQVIRAYLEGLVPA